MKNFFKNFFNDAEIIVAYDDYSKGKYEKVLRKCRPLAEQGNSDAQFLVGKIYNEGDGVPQDYKEAVKWYKLSVKQGNVNAQNSLGLLYANGEGVKQNYKEAVKLYRLSAECGNSLGQAQLGTMYLLGTGVPQDNVIAHMWYNLATAASGLEEVVEARDAIAECMTAEEIERAQKMAGKFVAKEYKRS